MDLFSALPLSAKWPITCVDMHTCGEPTRIVIRGYPELLGSLLEQRAQARQQYDDIRLRLMLEPRGHFDMYGAILRQHTELVDAGEADIGVLFTTNDGYSTMCGHATMALGRFLVDTHDLDCFPRRESLKFNPESRTVIVRLHAPCGIVVVKVPATENGRKSDPTRPVSFTSVDCFATGLNVTIDMPPHPLWPDGLSVVADFSYGGAFYCLVPVQQLPFLKDGLQEFEMEDANYFTKILKSTVNGNPDFRYLFQHPDENDLSFLYSVILTDNSASETTSSELGLCFFSDQQVDRSPTGSGVSARLAASYAHGDMQLGDSRAYHSLVSYHLGKNAAFRGTVLEECAVSSHTQYPSIKTRVEGHASYTGTHTFFLENDDLLPAAFSMGSLANKYPEKRG